jgi:hypothetical protein
MAVNAKIMFLWGVTPYYFVTLMSSALKKEAAGYSETLVPVYTVSPAE